MAASVVASISNDPKVIPWDPLISQRRALATAAERPVTQLSRSVTRPLLRGRHAVRRRIHVPEAAVRDRGAGRHPAERGGKLRARTRRVRGGGGPRGGARAAGGGPLQCMFACSFQREDGSGMFPADINTTEVDDSGSAGGLCSRACVRPVPLKATYVAACSYLWISRVTLSHLVLHRP